MNPEGRRKNAAREKQGKKGVGPDVTVLVVSVEDDYFPKILLY